MSKLATLKSRRALAVRHHGADSEQARKAAEKLAAEKAAVDIKRIVDRAPQFSPQQRDAIIAIFAEPAGGDVP